MAFFFGDGFDLYAQASDAYQGGTYWETGVSSTSALAPGRFSGSKAFAFSSSSSTSSAVLKNSGVNESVHHLSFAVQQITALSGTTIYTWFTLGDGATAQCSVAIRSDGAMLLTSGAANGTILATYTGAITAINTWYQFEVEVVINNTTGSFAVRKNGNTTNDFSATSLNTRGGTANNYANRLSSGGINSGPSLYVDDFLWRSDPSSVAWVGDIRCYTRRPMADVSVQWTRPSTFQIPPFFGSTSVVSAAANGARYAAFLSQGGTIGSVALTMNAAYTGNIKCAIYLADGTGGGPATVVQSATAPVTNPGVGTATFTFSPAVSITKGVAFWVAICPDTAGTSAFAAASASDPYYSIRGLNGTTTYASFPVANPTSLTQSQVHPLFPIVTVSANSDAVSDLFEDSAGSYNSDANVGDSDLYTLQSIGSTPATIIGVTTRGLFQKSDAGTRNVAVQLKSGATTVQSASTALNTTWGWISRNDLVDPATGAAWTATGVNNVNIGAQVTA